MNDAGSLPRHMLDIQELTVEAFGPYGQIIAPLRTGGQGAETHHDPETSASEAKLVLGHGEPRLWIMHLPHVGLGFTRIARHRRVTQCLGSSFCCLNFSQSHPPNLRRYLPGYRPK